MLHLAERAVVLGPGHCCVCATVCGHIGGPFLCERHRDPDVTVVDERRIHR